MTSERQEVSCSQSRLLYVILVKPFKLDLGYSFIQRICLGSSRNLILSINKALSYKQEESPIDPIKFRNGLPRQ